MNTHRAIRTPIAILGILAILGYGATAAKAWVWAGPAESTASSAQVASAVVRRANAPYFEDGVRAAETAILWFGRVTTSENWADARIGYAEDYLWIRVAIMDRRLWYDTSPTPADLNNWDAVSLYLDLDGNTGNAPDSGSYRFDGQLVWWEPRDSWQAAYTGSGGAWAASTMSFETSSGWRGYEIPNDTIDDRGWYLTYTIPFESLGLNSAPSQGTVWGMAIAVHDRDALDATPLADKTWPSEIDPQEPVTWGQLAFGLPDYKPQLAVQSETITIRQGLDGAQVVDGAVGGGFLCGSQAGPDFFPQWGSLNYAGDRTVNIQNQWDIADWPCFSRYYVTFPLTALPAGKVIMSAKLTMYQSGNAGEGWDPGPVPSFIQILTVAEPWDENTLTWNNSPLGLENVGGAWADIFPQLPGEERQWDVGWAVDKAYSEGKPLRIALYESDTEYHSGKYFLSSDTEDYYATLRPTLSITIGDALADLQMSARPSAGYLNDVITFTLNFRGTGDALTLTDQLPEGLGIPGTVEISGTTVAPTYDGEQHVLTWSDAPPLGQLVTIRYSTPILLTSTSVLNSCAELLQTLGNPSTAYATVIANPHQALAPIVIQNH